jgi:pilus assembly protein CpaB
MRRGRVFLYLSLILILLVVGGYLLYQNFFRPTVTTDVPIEVEIPDRVNIVVITQKAPRGTILDETVLGLISLPRDLLIDGMFTDLAMVVGRQAKFDLDSGIPITRNMLVDSADQLSAAGSVASLSIPEGMVAKTIPINRLASVSYALRPGDRVVVIASLQFIDIDPDFQTRLPNDTAILYGSSLSLSPEGGPSRITSEVSEAGGKFGRAESDEEFPEENIYVVPAEAQRPRLATQIIIPSAIVLHVGDFAYEKEELTTPEVPEPAPPAPDGEAAPVQEEEPPDNITLIVTPQEAVYLTYLIDSGVDMNLALRSAGDSTVIDTQTATLQFFLDDYAIPLPGKLSYGLAPRVDKVPDPGVQQQQPQPSQ